MKIAVKKLRPEAKIPTYGSELAAGADLYAALESAVEVKPGETRLIPHGIAMEIPAGYAGFVYARSGLAMRQGLAPANKVGVIDADYRGELCTPIYNQSDSVRVIEPGERIAQLVIAPVLHGEFAEVEGLSDTARGSSGFGSTGTK